MEANPGDFPMSNVNSALQKISQSITPEALEKVELCSLMHRPLYFITFRLKQILLQQTMEVVSSDFHY